MNRPETLREIDILLRDCLTLSLATVDDDGQPHAANLQYAIDDQLRLIFLSNPASAHSLHIARNHQIAATVYAEVRSPTEIHGVQLHGRCAALDDQAKREAALAVFADRYPFIQADDAIRARVDAETVYRITPTWLRLIDNRKGFGWKAEIGL